MKKITRGLLISVLLLFFVGVGFVIAGLAMGVSSGDLKELIEQHIPVEYDIWEKHNIEHIIFSDDDMEVRNHRYGFDPFDVKELDLD